VLKTLVSKLMHLGPCTRTQKLCTTVEVYTCLQALHYSSNSRGLHLSALQ
jgi:hypothetical protein